MTPQELKTSILWSAIQGKISKQEGSESAQDILRGLSLSSITEDEFYFDIPSNWKWCKIKDIFTLVNGKAFKPTDWGQTGLPIVRIQNLNDSNAPFNYFSGDIEEKYILHGGELLFSWSGTPGTSFGSFIWNGGKAVLNQHIFIVYPRFQLDTKYAMYALNGELKIFIEKAHGGAGLKHITKKEFENCVLPIPPFAEQKRIVAKLEEILPLIDRYETAWSKLEEFNKRFPGDMQKSILQMAIQGKLVPQIPEEGTGEELFQQIQAAFQEDDSKPKRRGKKAAVAVTTEQDPPFDIPETWKWVKLGQLGYTNIGLTYSPKDTCNDGVVVLRSSNIQNGKMDYEDIVRVSCDIPDNKMCHIGDILICARNGSKRLVGKAALIDQEGMSFGAFMAIFRSVCNPYILHVINSAYFRNTLLGDTGTTTINQITQDMLKNVMIPLPPLEEQKRIVAKLEEILPLCERLK